MSDIVVFVAKSKTSKKWKAYIQKYVSGYRKTFVNSIGEQNHFGFDDAAQAERWVQDRFKSEKDLQKYADNAGEGLAYAKVYKYWSYIISVQMSWQDQKPRMLMNKRKYVYEEKEVVAVKKKIQGGRKPQGDEYLFFNSLGLRKDDCNNLFSLLSRALEMDVDTIKKKCANRYKTEKLLDVPLNTLSTSQLEEQQGWFSEAAQIVREELERRKKPRK